MLLMENSRKMIPFNESFIDFADDRRQIEKGLISEAYHGRTPEILKIQEAVSAARHSDIISAPKFNVSRERELIEEALCNAFGFACCQFSVDPSSIMNAYTIPVSSVPFDFKNYKKFVVNSGNGLRYTPEANVYCIIAITSSVFFNPSFTDEEITALILREVGHNFQNVINSKFKPLSLLKRMLLILSFPAAFLMHPTTSPFRNAFTDWIRSIRRDSSGLSVAYWSMVGVVKGIYEAGLNWLKFLSNISGMLNPLAAWSSLPISIYQKLNLHTLTIPLSYRQEVIADEFATTYGYGTELSSALNKMEHKSGGVIADQMFREGIFGNYFDLVMLPQKMVATLFDAHPENIARINATVESNRKALNSITTNPKMKKELNEQLAETQSIINDISKSATRGYKYSDSWATILLFAFGGDIRKGFGKDVDIDFDAAEDLAKRQYIDMKQR